MDIKLLHKVATRVNYSNSLSSFFCPGWHGFTRIETAVPPTIPQQAHTINYQLLNYLIPLPPSKSFPYDTTHYAFFHLDHMTVVTLRVPSVQVITMQAIACEKIRN